MKFSDIYIAYLPLVVFLLNLLYGLLNIEGVGDSDSRYSLLFGVFGLVPTVLGYGISFLANLIVGITYVIKAKKSNEMSDCIPIDWQYFFSNFSDVCAKI